MKKISLTIAMVLLSVFTFSEALQAESATAGKWRVSIRTDPIDDSKMVYFVLDADTGVGVYRDPVKLTVRNYKYKTEVFINWASYLGSQAIVTIRLGTNPAEILEWNLSGDSKASFYPGEPGDLVGLMAKVDTLAARVTPYNENPITAVFDLRGLKELATLYSENISWKIPEEAVPKRKVEIGTETRNQITSSVEKIVTKLNSERPVSKDILTDRLTALLNELGLTGGVKIYRGNLVTFTINVSSDEDWHVKRIKLGTALWLAQPYFGKVLDKNPWVAIRDLRQDGNYDEEVVGWNWTEASLLNPEFQK